MRRLVAEFIGTFLITAAVVGSGFMATNLTRDVALQLLVNGLSTVAILWISITIFAKVSGAHFNPIITLIIQYRTERDWLESAKYIVAQIIGGAVGAITANLMFDASPISISETSRTGGGLFLAEVIASTGLVILALGHWIDEVNSSRATLISLWIFGAYFFTASTSFANPAVTIGRSLSDSFAGIAPASLIGFIGAQIIGGLLALAFINQFERGTHERK
jgi:glycerol uptake facilitator-like aquaporin